MKVLTPTAITAANLVSSSAAESYSEWLADVTYNAGQRVVRPSTRRVYERLALGAGSVAPESDAVNWQDAGPMNKWAMFDDSPSTATTAAGSLSVYVAPGAVNDIVLHGVKATQVQVYGGAAGATLLRTVTVPAPTVPATVSTVTISGLGVAAGNRVGLVITGSGTVSVGSAMFGTFAYVGETQHGWSVGLQDFSRVETNDWGVTTITRRSYSRRLSGQVRVQTGAVDDTTAILEGLRATVAWWSADDSYAAMQCMGWLRDWSTTINGAAASTLSLTIEGLSVDDAVIYPGAVVGAEAAESLTPGSAAVMLYQRTGTATAPSLPNASITYEFATGATSGVTNGWSRELPTSVGAYLWATTATAYGAGTQVIIQPAAWQAAALLAQDGATGAKGDPGQSGVNGTRTAILDLYRWGTSTPTAWPTGTSTYTWATGQFTPPANLNGWSATPPAAVTGQNLYICRQVYADTGNTATSNVTWTTTSALNLTSAGANGQRVGVLEVYLWAASAPTVYPAGTSTYTWATGQFTPPSTPNGWSLIPGAAVAGQTLWGISTVVSDALTTATSTATWNSSTVYAVGAAGANGAPGQAGATGPRGTVQVARAITGAAWSDTEAAAAISANGSGSPVLGDVVTLFNNSASPRYSEARVRTASAWAPLASYINGSLLVDGTVVAQKIDARGLSILDAAGNVILGAGTGLPASYAPAMGSNLIPCSDFSKLPQGDWAAPWTIDKGGWAIGDNTLTNVTQVGVNLGDWFPAGGYALYVRQMASNNSTGYVEYSSVPIPVEELQWYMLSCYTGAHRAMVAVFLYVYDSAGTLLGFRCMSTNDAEASGGKSLSGYKRQFAIGQMFSGAAQVRVRLRKYDTKPGNSDSWGFFSCPMLERVSALATAPGPYSSGPTYKITAANASTWIESAAIGSAQIANASITDAHIASLNAGKITAGSITTDKLSVGSVSSLTTLVTPTMQYLWNPGNGTTQALVVTAIQLAPIAKQNGDVTISGSVDVAMNSTAAQLPAVGYAVVGVKLRDAANNVLASSLGNVVKLAKRNGYQSFSFSGALLRSLYGPGTHQLHLYFSIEQYDWYGDLVGWSATISATYQLTALESKV